ncbi:hypothetical protein Ait01nite_070880 [Actinoplanes italicus]|uniref:Uncharacterized protein n=1 Tax=Actinoplanes italicus TaxID=113567 RepID=A0A2T0JVF0_9ACTN|nr:hypothetical protein [Actinoplanes italicus]PRX11430.1 hypothetical protein CLV67_1316 [Actinoplanes italicus]GIE34043.1 hypothetical protein Ait01nite_070880 [Actinoplanes italicus]
MSVLRKAIAAIITVLALVGAVRLILPATDDHGVRRQLAFLRTELESGADTDAQALFPEGYYFLNVLYGLTWVELGRRGVEPERAAAEAAWALSRLESPAGRAPFDAAATPPYGVFWAGWTNWLRGGLLTIRDDPAQRTRLVADSRALAAAFDASATPFLQAYPGQSWPCDSTVAVASLRLADRVTGTAEFAPAVDRWVSRARGLLDPATGLLPHQTDPATGLLPHQTDPATGAAVTGARGTSQAIIQRFLPDVDPAFAREQYPLFREQFLARPLGLGPAIREYPHGTGGVADVDSGPLILGISLSTTVAGLGAARTNGDASLAAALANFGELAGLPLSTFTTKRYAFGLVPVGDAFLAWSKSATPWTTATPPAPPAAISAWWRFPLLTLLLLLGLSPWLPALRRRLTGAAPRPATK